MAINRAPFNALVDDDGTNTLGTPWNKSAIASVLLDPIDAALVSVNADSLDGLDSTAFVKVAGLGTWVLLPPVLGASGGGAAVLQTNNGCQYSLVGKTVTVSFYLVVVITGAVNTVTLALPSGLVSAAFAAMPFYLAGVGAGFAQVTPGGTTINLYRDPQLAPWTAGAPIVAGVMPLAVQ